MKKIFLFAVGVVVGASVIVNELLRERLIVNNNLDGSITFRHPTGIYHYTSVKAED